MTSWIGAFLLAFPALFSIVNPLGSALIFNDVTADRSQAERHHLATRIALYSAAVLLGSLWLGGYLLAFFGVSLGALRIAGGLVVAVRAWELLMQPQEHETRKADAAASAQDCLDDVAFFPLTMPFTTGPGSIAVAIALSSQRPAEGVGTLSFFGGVSAAALCIAALIWLCYRWSDRVGRILGPSGARVVSRLVAFLLLSVGVQIIVTGVESLVPIMMRVT
ncbi:MarC family protein [Glacieibacterium megasporae]|uniref:MarC family protein n=1 Tax=Glacieibacterium megasporae TaxID=2835787 RepID=UPI001C1DDE7B|nr:MarC family protein [Polymorphobacter megasporae]UAJ11014.1 MarC family protein [Polymorphobacter megasporae]